jgi:hypothetical protein
VVYHSHSCEVNFDVLTSQRKCARLVLEISMGVLAELIAVGPATVCSSLHHVTLTVRISNTQLETVSARSTCTSTALTSM